MCLAMPGKVVARSDEQDSLAMGVVDFGGFRQNVCLEWLPEVHVGDYVLVHVGFAISVLDQEEARTTLRLLEQAHHLQEEQSGI